MLEDQLPLLQSCDFLHLTNLRVSLTVRESLSTSQDQLDACIARLPLLEKLMIGLDQQRNRGPRMDTKVSATEWVLPKTLTQLHVFGASDSIPVFTAPNLQELLGLSSRALTLLPRHPKL